MDFDNVPLWLVIVGAIIAGALAAWGVLDKQLRDRNKEKDNLEDRVRALYQEESKQLRDSVDDLTEQVKTLRTENEVITKIFQGKDTNTQEFQKQGFEVMKQFAITNSVISETHKLMVETNGNMVNMAKSIEKMATALEKNVGYKTQVSVPPGSELTVKKNS